MRTTGTIQRTVFGVILGAGLLWLPVTLLGALGAQDDAGTTTASLADPTASASVSPAAASNVPGGAAGANAKPAAPAATFVGSAACKACHAKSFTAWSASVHGQALSQESLPPEKRGCEACHGAGSLHAGSAGRTRLRIPSADDPKTANAVCGSCHLQGDSSTGHSPARGMAGTQFERTMHARQGLACVSCHMGHPSGNDKQLTKPMPELCLSCHGSVMESAPGKKAAYTHMPVAEGQCLTCHDPHGTPDRNMVVPDVQKTCLECHDVTDAQVVSAHKGYPVADSKCAQCHDPHSHDQKAKLVRTRQHLPFKQGNCEVCHTKPAAGQPVGLVKPARELCMTCHPASKITPVGEHAHVPAKEGLCLSCHNPHVSSRPALMKTRPAYACFTCHSKVEMATVAEHRHKVVETSLDCMMCHKPHSSVEDKLLIKDQISMCGQCHKHSFSHPIGKKADGTVVLNPRNGDPMTCSSCHDIHGSKNESMTIAEKDRDLCVLCHRDLEE